ncbi:MAG TPA: KpsF/GutQ family sugar-phosphate isomerase [Rickettsiales bacterium]|nr:KpsF/GutQ family sugar-phosphate isomerase [Rickettsiales bacterium]
MTQCKDYGIHSIQTEIKGLQSILNNSINDTFEKVVKAILKTKGRVVLSGVGKPGYIAHRVAATLASTGTIATYVHANEASHGDLGMISKSDTVILLSNSGGSKEINDIIAYCKRFDITLIGLTRNPDSFLAKASTIPVVLEDVEQTNIVNSPTTSEIMFLAYLDAVATALININHFDKDKYKIFHPGGKLGSALLKVEEIMHKGDELPIVHEDDNMEKVINIMIEKPLGCVGVLDKNDNLIGIITDGDFKRKIIQYKNLTEKKISEIMTPNPITVEKDMFALDAVKIMEKGVGEDNNYIQVLFVVETTEETKKVIGLIHIQDCLRAGVI